ncbi:hypothetical protein [Desulfovibrio ferrophilus]|nr:hypothetical protein [Desulfovibrio ferrophilus]
MDFFETPEMSNAKVTRFLGWYDRGIGTDRERNSTDEGHGYVVCFELTNRELMKCSQWVKENAAAEVEAQSL